MLFNIIRSRRTDYLRNKTDRGFPNAGISIMAGHLRNINIYVQRQYVRESAFRTDAAKSSMKWVNIITRHVYSVRDLILSRTLMDYTALSVRGV